LLLVLLTATSPASARTTVFTYTCRVDGKSLAVRIDDRRKTLRWRNKLYAITGHEDCAKFGWRATRPGEAFDFCTATQGYADFREGDRLIQCDQDR
jgi:hypothetical protein